MIEPTFWASAKEIPAEIRSRLPARADIPLKTIPASNHTEISPVPAQSAPNKQLHEILNYIGVCDEREFTELPIVNEGNFVMARRFPSPKRFAILKYENTASTGFRTRNSSRIVSPNSAGISFADAQNVGSIMPTICPKEYPHEQVNVILFEDLIQNPNKQLHEILNYIGTISS